MGNTIDTVQHGFEDLGNKVHDAYDQTQQGFTDVVRDAKNGIQTAEPYVIAGGQFIGDQIIDKSPAGFVCKSIMELVRELEGGYPDWMGALPDGTSMRSLTIPGTHDSGTTNGASMSDISDVTHNLEVTISHGLVVAQDRSIYDQLYLGIRFLDIRCNNNFGIQHGDYTISNISFETVLNDCKRFLHDHPHEIILMSVKHEDKNDFPGFADAFRDRFFKAGGFPWFGGKDIPSSIDNSIRGKIVLINRFDRNFTDFGFVINVNDNGETHDEYVGVKYHIQDYYKVDTSCDGKFEQVLKFATDAANNTTGDFYLNFASGVNVPEPISHTAGKINSRLTAKLDNQVGHFGVIIMDFPTKDLVRDLIGSNQYYKKA